MKLTFLGTSHGIAEPNRYCSSTVLTVNGKHYVIDAGAPILDLFLRYGFKFEDIAGIFVTHSHEDHMLGLVPLTSTMGVFKEFSHISFPVYVPDLKKYRDMFCFMFGAPEFTGNVIYNRYKEGVIFDDGNVKIKAIATKHCAHSHAFVIEAENKTIAFTGDLTHDLTDYPNEFVERETPLELVVMEAAHQTYSKNYVFDILSKTKTRAMIINHIYEKQNPIETLNDFGKKTEKYFTLAVSYDGMSVEL